MRPEDIKALIIFLEDTEMQARLAHEKGTGGLTYNLSPEELNALRKLTKEFFYRTLNWTVIE